MSIYINSSLNKSTSKQLYSFPKSPRFSSTIKQEVIDAFYQHRARNNQKSYSFAKSQRLKTDSNTNGTSSQFFYDIQGDFEAQIKRKAGVKILYGRENCKSKGIFAASDNPGPGNYNPNSEVTKVRISSQCSIGNSQRGKVSNPQNSPGPGCYNVGRSLLNDGRVLSNDVKESYGRMLFQQTKPQRIKTEQGPEIRFPAINNKGEPTFQKGRGFKIGTSARFGKREESEDPGPGAYKIYSEFIQVRK